MHRTTMRLLTAMMLALVMLDGVWLAGAQSRPSPRVAPAIAPDRAQVAQTLHSSPVMFIENVGQFDKRARFQVRGDTSTMWLADDAIWITVMDRPDGSTRQDDGEAFSEAYRPQRGVNLELSFPAANPDTCLEPFDHLDTHVSYFIGDSPDEWHSNVPVWRGVRYKNLNDGLNLELTGDNGHLVLRVVGQGTAELDAVRLKVKGADGVALEGDQLRLTTPLGDFMLPLPTSEVALQVEGVLVNGERITARTSRVPSSVAIAGGQVRTDAQGATDLLFASFVGGSSNDVANGIAAGASLPFVAGTTYSSDFPVTPGAFDKNPGLDKDAFVLKMNGFGTGLHYATFLGGNDVDVASAIAVDSLDSAQQDAYVTGWTKSVDFPTTEGAFDSRLDGESDAFVVKLDPLGERLIYSTLLGGIHTDAGRAVDEQGGAPCVTGWTDSPNFPTTEHGLSTTLRGDWDAFVACLSDNGAQLGYGTYLGGTHTDLGHSIVRYSADLFVAGYTKSADFPHTLTAFDSSHNGGWDAFVIRFSPIGNFPPQYATFLGGSGDDGNEWSLSKSAMAVDETGRVYVTGDTVSSDFPTTTGAFDTSHNGQADAFVVKLNPGGTQLEYSTFLGGSADDHGWDIAINAIGNAFVTGYTNSPDFPISTGAIDRSHNGDYDAFAVKMSGLGDELVHATFLGGSDCDQSRGITVFGEGHVYLTGNTESSDYPVTQGAFDTQHNGHNDAFVAHLTLLEAAPTPLPTPTCTATPSATHTPTVAPTGLTIFGAVQSCLEARIAEATVRLHGTDVSALTDSQGLYQLGPLADFLAGTYALAASKEGYQTREIILELPSVGTVGQNFAGLYCLEAGLTHTPTPTPTGTGSPTNTPTSMPPSFLYMPIVLRRPPPTPTLTPTRTPRPTYTPTATRTPTHTSRPTPTPTRTPTNTARPTSTPTRRYCCKCCREGKACGDTCISRSYTCHKPPGCACDWPNC